MELYDEQKVGVRVFTALANITRFAILQTLVNKFEKIKQGDLAKELSIPPQTLSFHLKEMLHAELLNQERDGTTIYYSLNKNTIARIAGFFNLQSSVLKKRPKKRLHKKFRASLEMH